MINEDMEEDLFGLKKGVNRYVRPDEYHRGHACYYRGDSGWYIDNDQPTSIERPCKKCGEMPTKEGHDHCLGTLPGVKWACCGHGITLGYIKFENGIRVSGYFEVDVTWIDAKNVVLEYLNKHDRPISVLEVAEEYDLPNDLVAAIFKELEEQEYIDIIEEKRKK